MQPYYLTNNLEELDPVVTDIIAHEEKRQNEKIILIASESICPLPVRQALNSVFTNLYAEGYPSLRMLSQDTEKLADIPYNLAYLKRYSDRRYYKGCDYVNFIETLAIKRVSELFATPDTPASHIFANVQALSGAAANNAVYEAFVKPGDTVMAMSLSSGGHLTHGNPSNRSGKHYNIISYSVDEKTGKLNYEKIMELANQHKPKMIIAGYSAYPWSIDWKEFKKIADSIKAILFADISHTAGLIAAGVHPGPVGYADVITFTTHKTLCGPRGAVILTTDEKKARKIDLAVFPGEQGGPHINNITAKAIAFKIAQTKEFKELQTKVVENCHVLGEELEKLGLKLAYKGTDSHLLMVNLKAINPKLSGEVASRLLDECNIVCNKNTVMGDTSAVHPSAIRLGTTWVTQLGMGKEHIIQLAGLIHKVLTNIKPYEIFGAKGYILKGKMEFEIMEEVKQEVKKLIASLPAFAQSPVTTNHSPFILLRGEPERLTPFLDEITTDNVSDIPVNQSKETVLLNYDNNVLDEILLLHLPSDSNLAQYIMVVNNNNTIDWLKGLSAGYLLFDKDDILAQIDGPVAIENIDIDKFNPDKNVLDIVNKWREKSVSPTHYAFEKPYFIGQKAVVESYKAVEQSKCNTYYSKEFQYVEKEEPLKRTKIYEEHLKLKGKITPFAGHEMPVWYTSISDEHKTVRESVGLFDVSHMGSIEVTGENAARFLDLVTTNYVPELKDGDVQYSYFLDVNGVPVDDLMVYRRRYDRYFLVVNAANAAKNLKWLNAVNNHEVLIDKENSLKNSGAPVVIRDLKDPANGADCKVDIALQGRNSIKMLTKIFNHPDLPYLHKFEFVITEFDNRELMISRTGYTGELYSFELFIHPDSVTKLWNTLLEAGKEYGIKPIGLGARDSLRTEAGLPLYGHELAGKYTISPIGAGYSPFVKLQKPFFIGRTPLLKAESTRKMSIVRFGLVAKGGRMLKTDDLVLDKRGQCIGNITSCAVGLDGKQVGLAYIDKSYAKLNTEIGLIPLPRDKKDADSLCLSDIKFGSRFPYPIDGLVLKRFR